MNKFLFNKCLAETAKLLNDEDRLAYYDAIMDYMLFEKEPSEKMQHSAVWKMTEEMLYRQRVKGENGKKGGAPKGNQHARKYPKTGKV